MTKYYCEFSGASNGGTWKGTTWTKVTYAGATGDGTALDALSALLWADMQASASPLLAANSGAVALASGVGMPSYGKQGWSSNGTNDENWEVSWVKWLPTSEVGPNHAIRVEQGDGNYQADLTSPGSAQTVIFAKSKYDDAAAAMTAIVANSVGSGTPGQYTGANLARTMASIQLNEDHTRIHWDSAPTWLSAVHGTSANRVDWTVNAASVDYEVFVWVGNTGTFAYEGSVVSTGNAYLATASADEWIVALGRSNDNFIGQVFEIPYTYTAPALTSAEISSGIAKTCAQSLYPRVEWDGTNFTGDDTIQVYRSYMSGSYTLVEEVPATDRVWVDLYYGPWQSDGGGSDQTELQYRVDLYHSSSYVGQLTTAVMDLGTGSFEYCL